MHVTGYGVEPSCISMVTYTGARANEFPTTIVSFGDDIDHGLLMPDQQLGKLTFLRSIGHDAPLD